MKVSKKQLVNGVIKFIENELMNEVGDRHMKFVLAMAKDSLKEDADIIDSFLKTPMISTLVTEEDGEYDLTHFSSILRSVLSEYDSYPVVLPKIPLFSPVEKTLKISADDIDKLIKYLTPETETTQS